MPGERLTLLRMILVALVVAGCALAQHGGTSIAADERDSQDIDLRGNVSRADGTVGIAVRVVAGLPNTPCMGRVSHDGYSRALPRVVTSNTGGAKWSWLVPRAVHRGRWRVKMRCLIKKDRFSTTTVSFTAPRGSGRGRRSRLFAPRTLLAEAVAVPALEGGSGGGGGALYPTGQCTWWVARKRPDLPFFPRHRGDAKNWLKSASRVGWPTGSVPRVGAVAVFLRGQYGAGKDGHVAFVEWVSPDARRIRISEANFGNRPPGSKRTISSDGLSFIYRQEDTRPAVTPSPTVVPVQTPAVTPSPGSEPPSGGQTSTPSATAQVRVTHYKCDYTDKTIAHSLNAGQRWSDDFTTRGTVITNGMLYVAARDDNGGEPHRATVGIYTDRAATQALGTVSVTVPIGGTGIEFTFSPSIAVRYEEPVYVVIKAQDPITVYDVDRTAQDPANPEGCFIGRMEGSSPPVTEEVVAQGFDAPTFRDYHSASEPGDAIAAAKSVRVFCKVYDPTIESSRPDGFWYRIASAPWRGDFYAAANLFLNGDPQGGPYENAVDPAVPDC